MSNERKIFIVVATGGHDTDRHYRDTIETKRTFNEAEQYLSNEEARALQGYTHGKSFVVWGAVPGKANLGKWSSMQPGDYVLIYRDKKIILAAEIALKVRNSKLAEVYWRRDRGGNTWELMYFMINEVKVNVPFEKLNTFLGYEPHFLPRGFMGIDQKKANTLLSVYGDVISILQKIERKEKPQEVDFEKKKKFDQIIEEHVRRSETEHDEMQWRLIRLGNKARFDVWVPSADQGRSYQGETFRDLVIPEFRESLDVPTYIKNIDTVWKLGLSIKSAFEIEHSTSVYSGILRLSDLRALAPNSNYPLFIVADEKRKSKVFQELQRPTFANDYLALDRIVKYLSYDALRVLDDNLKETDVGFDIQWLTEKAESVIK